MYFFCTISILFELYKWIMVISVSIPPALLPPNWNNLQSNNHSFLDMRRAQIIQWISVNLISVLTFHTSLTSQLFSPWKSTNILRATNKRCFVNVNPPSPLYLHSKNGSCKFEINGDPLYFFRSRQENHGKTISILI